MVHLHDIPPRTRSSVENLACPTLYTAPVVSGIPLDQRRVAVVSTAGVHERGDKRFDLGSSDFRTIRAKAVPADILMTHLSINYDRTGFMQDINTILPLDRLAELEQQGVIGSVAENHYSFMGATDPAQMEPEAAQVAGMLKADQVDAVLLVPV
jgi:D-proline reductase (dithiol) PrdB